ncbi:Metalloprotease [Coprinopsis sp. MPI-PUGE-AT-0042]|nr:Metalloprotease [Coprinopsis sp. MPI-PUGE-AT-0042]
MIWSSLLSLALAASASAFPFAEKRASDVEIALSTGANKVASIQDIEITAAVTNNGAQEAKLFKYSTILDNLPTSSFIITKDGQSVPFIGIRMSVDLEALDESAFVTIPAGETFSITHKVGKLYDFSKVGTGSFTFEPRINFFKAEAADAFSTFDTVTVDKNTVTIEVTDDVAKEAQTVEKRARNICTNSSRASQITSSVSESRTLAQAASSYISSRGTSDSLYQAYWSSNTASRISGVFNAVANENSSSRTLDCTDPYGVCSGGVIAYTVIATTNIYFCSIFFSEVSLSALCSGSTTVAARNLRGGTTLHELTHAVSGTDDVTYGCAADQRLSAAQKAVNADNYNCFSTQVYKNTRC